MSSQSPQQVPQPSASKTHRRAGTQPNPICRGTITGTARSVFNPHRLRVRTYDVTVEQPGAQEEDPCVENFEVTVEDGWVVLHA